MRLDTENKVLSDTIKWMHDTIWGNDPGTEKGGADWKVGSPFITMRLRRQRIKAGTT